MADDKMTIYKCSLCSAFSPSFDGLLGHICSPKSSGRAAATSDPADEVRPEGGDGEDAKQEASASMKWSYSATRLLISSVRDLQQMFRSPVYRKSKVWKQVAEKMAAAGHDHTAEQCDKKMRGLKYRHKLIDSSQKTGNDRRAWEYFEAMEELVAWSRSAPPPPQSGAGKPSAMTSDPTDTIRGEDVKRGASASTTWSYSATTLLISSVRDLQPLFRRHTSRQTLVWKQVARKMEAEGRRFTGRQCAKKMRSLRYRYKVIDSSPKTGNDRRAWEYFGAMEDLLSWRSEDIGSSFDSKHLQTPKNGETKPSRSRPPVGPGTGAASCPSRRSGRGRPERPKPRRKGPERDGDLRPSLRSQIEELIRLQTVANEVERETNRIVEALVEAVRTG